MQCGSPDSRWGFRLVGLLLSSSLVLLAALSVHAADRPNIVLIMADDVGVDAIGCYGGRSHRTPNIDRLALFGVRFNHCYSMPSCHPTRIALLTGRYPRRLGNPRWGSFPRSEEPHTIANVLKQAGYATAVAGKWQLSLLSRDLQQPHRMGFEQYSVFGWHEGPRYYEPLIFENGKRRTDVAGRYGPDVYCEFLLDFMRRNRSRPFFAYFPMALCHDVTDDLSKPVPYGPRGRYDSFAEMMKEMDRVIGKLVAGIDELKLRKRTLILFTADNGTPSRSILRAEDGRYIRVPVFSNYRGRKVQGGKTKLTNGGTHVPLIANWPDVLPAGRTVDDLVDFSDWLPTLAEVAGAKLPAGVRLDGRSFAGRLQKSFQPAPRQWAYAEARKRFWVRTQRWKLYNTGQLFDLQTDPLEARPLGNNLSGEAARVRNRLLPAVNRLKRIAVR